MAFGVGGFLRGCEDVHIMVKIGNASIGSNGKISGDKAGDQNGKEVCIRDWYSKPWTHVIRFKREDMRKKNAECMIKACNNNHIGYNQLRRNTLLQYAANVGYDPSKVDKVCDTDCSALVSLCVIYAGVPQGVMYQYGNSCTTANLRNRLNKTGLVNIMTDKAYTTKPDKLMVGDILLAEGKHVAIVVQTDEAMNIAPKKDIHAVALDVIDGKYSDGGRRRALLMDAGYDPDEVQKEVNRILKGK